MHRLILQINDLVSSASSQPKRSSSILPLRALAIILLLAGCAHSASDVRDTPYVEQLRVRITKVRHAIDETRATIAASQGAPYLPELYVRLAELLSEEARYHFQVAQEREGRSQEAVHAPQVVFLKEQAINTYRMVLRRYPDTPLAPRILFNISHEQRELGDFEEMIETLKLLISQHRQDPLANEALLVLGDYHFDRSELRQASNYYRQILRGGPSAVSGLAFYKMGWVRVNQGNCTAALEDFENAIVASRAWTGRERTHTLHEFSPSRGLDVQRESLIDLTYCYARVRKPEEAVPYLRKHASSRSVYVAALERMGRRFAVMEQALGAAEVGRELLRLAPDNTERLEDGRMLYNALRRLENWESIGNDTELITKAVLRRVHNSGVSDSEKERVLQEFEVYIRDLLTRSQKALLDGKGDQAVLSVQLAGAYNHYLNAFQVNRHRTEMLLNLAEVHALAGDNFAAGRRYLDAALQLEKFEKEAALASNTPQSTEDDSEEGEKIDLRQLREDRKGALYDSVVYFQRTLESSEELKPVDRVVSGAGLRRAGLALLGFDDIHSDRVRQVAFAVAKTLYDDGSHTEAIDKLTAVAYAWPNTTESRAAIHLVLDSYRTINDFDGLMAAGHRFLADGGPADAALKAEIRPIVTAAEQTRLDQISLAAAGDTGGGIEELEVFAERYEGTDLGERALINAFVAARAAGESEVLYRLGDEIRARYPSSEQLPGIMGTLGRTAVARYELDRAVSIFRQAADTNRADRVSLLLAAGGLLEQMGDLPGARDNYQQAYNAAEDRFGRDNAAERLAVLLEKMDIEPRQLALTLSQLSDDNTEVQARLGLAQLRVGDPMTAEGTLHGVISSGTASSEAMARAHYGMAEAMVVILNDYEPAGDVESLHELIALVEVAQQSYLNAARYGSPIVTPAALTRLANLNSIAADRIQNLTLPAELSAQDRDLLQRAFSARAEQLRQESANALAACSEQSWTRQTFNPAARVCLAGRPAQQDPIAFDNPKPRGRPQPVQGIEELRTRLARNPEDLDSLRELGLRFLDNNDPHIARLVFARTGAAGGGPMETNLLGVSSYLAGDLSSALESFAAAADGGLAAGRDNLVRVLRELGLNDAANQAIERYQVTISGGRLIDGGTAGRGES